jgi:type IV secretion system protein VirB3
MSIEQDPLFGGLTRPSTLFGVPPAAFGVIMVVPLMLLIATRMVMFAGLIPVLYGIFRAICAKDPRMLRYLALASQTKWRGLNRAFWRASSYSPVRFRRR